MGHRLPGDGGLPPGGRDAPREDRRDGSESGSPGEDGTERRCRHRVALSGDKLEDDRFARPRPLRAADRIPENRTPVIAKQPDSGGSPAVEGLPEFADPGSEPPAVEGDLDDPAGSPPFVDRGAPAVLEVASSL